MLLSVAGSVRTNNFSDPLIMQKISQLWSSHTEEQRMEHYAGRSFYAVYHEYAADFRGDYTLSLCCDAQGKGRTFDTDLYTYRSFPVSSGNGGVVEAWKNIWSLEQQDLLKRSYSVDFEWYRPDGTTTIEIAIA